MAAGTITYPYKRGKDVYGHSAVVPFLYTGGNPYATGGDVAFLAGLIKLGVIEWILAGWGIKISDGTQAVKFEWNYTTGAMQAFWGNTTPAGLWPEVTNGTDLSGFQAICVAFGKG